MTEDCQPELKREALRSVFHVESIAVTHMSSLKLLQMTMEYEGWILE